MSQKNKQDGSTGASSRRDFIRHAALGTAAITLGLTFGERVLARVARRHADDFFGKARETSPNEEDETAFLRLFDEVREMVDGNREFKANFDKIFQTVVNSSGRMDLTEPITRLGIHTDITNLLAAGYLGGLAFLRERAPSKEQISNILSNPESVNKFIEAGFVDSLYRRANEEIEANPEFRKNAGSAVSQLERGAAGRDREPCINEVWVWDDHLFDVPCWVTVVVIVVVVVAIVAKIV
jgi:hypothetical protein